jgi:sarcosine oxidase
MRNHYDVILAGAGSMGAAAAYYLAKNKCKTLVLEKFPSTPHTNGSHTGQSRIIRKAYFEHPGYVPILDNAYFLWNELQKATGEELYIRTGLLYSGLPSNPVIKGVKQASLNYNIPVDDIGSSYSGYPFTFPEGNSMLFERNAGFLLPEKAIRVFLGEAINNGVIFNAGEELTGWKREGETTIVNTDKDIYHTEKLVITSGAWAGKLTKEWNLPLKITRQLMIWVEPVEKEKYYPGNFPCWMIAGKDGEGVYYGFPFLQGDRFPGPAGMKFAWHYAGTQTDPDAVNRNITKEEIRELINRVKEYFPAADSKLIAASTCLYSNTPDENFIIDHLPGSNEKIIIACGFSGHGFKFAPAIGKILSDLVIKGNTEHNIDFLKLTRPQVN